MAEAQSFNDTPDDVSVELEHKGDPTIDTFSLNVDFANGRKVEISVKFPKGNGMAAIHAFERLGTQQGLVSLLEALSYDQSVQKTLDEAGLTIVDEDFDDDSDTDADVFGDEDTPDDGFDDEVTDEEAEAARG
ncbi:hypothetical protein SEA_RASPUTIA_132 [Microbacterium phage Rasputia]|nr:hypothetical protein SEA_RASPUTIA_132 [Microbacterium phage Rasputia]